MRILYVFPHPDDESFGPALAIAKQKREGHGVHLLTLTRGGATSQRERLGYTVEQMGRVRLGEMQRMAATLGLASLEVLDDPDGGLDDLNPLKLERAVTDHILDTRPSVVVTYACHGISGHRDHLVAHAIVKRVFAAERTAGKDNFLRRLAFFTLLPSQVSEGDRLSGSREDQIDCVIEVGDREIETARAALSCYETYGDVIRDQDPLGRMGRQVGFEIFRERHDPRLDSLTTGL